MTPRRSSIGVGIFLSFLIGIPTILLLSWLTGTEIISVPLALFIAFMAGDLKGFMQEQIINDR